MTTPIDLKDADNPRRPKKRTTGQLFRRRLSAGIILIIPIWITIALTTFIFRMMRDASLWAVEAALAGPVGKPLVEWLRIDTAQLRESGYTVLPTGLQWGVGILACLVSVLILYFLGMITSHLLGRRLIGAAEMVVDRLPIVKTIYRACKQVLEAFAGDSKGEYQRVGLIPFPSEQTRSIGFITKIFRDRATNEEFCACFIATTPNPTSGFVFVCPRRTVIELDFSVEEAIRMIMSGGVLLPEVMRVTKEPATAPGVRPSVPATGVTAPRP
jgi:uncharacterized membrane protein